MLDNIGITCYVDGDTHLKPVTRLILFPISAEKLFKRFKDNQMKGNTDKCHLILSTGDSS